MSKISEVLAKDPLHLTRENIDDVIEYYRGLRTRFIAGDKNAGAPKKLTDKERAAQKLSINLDLKL